MGARNFGRELFGLFLLFLALFLLLALASFDEHDPSLNQVVSSSVKPKNMAGMFGAYVSGFLNDIFGVLAFLWPLVFAFLGVTHVSPRLGINWSRWCGWFLLVICLFILASACDFSIGHLARGGQVGDTIYAACSLYLSPFGTAVAWLFLFLSSMQLIFGISWLAILDRLIGQVKKWQLARQKQQAGQTDRRKTPASEKAASANGTGEKFQNLVTRLASGQAASAESQNDSSGADQGSNEQNAKLNAPALPNLEDLIARGRNFLGKLLGLAEILTKPVPIPEQNRMPDLNLESGIGSSEQQPGQAAGIPSPSQPRSGAQPEHQPAREQVAAMPTPAPPQRPQESPGFQPSQAQAPAPMTDSGKTYSGMTYPEMKHPEMTDSCKTFSEAEDYQGGTALPEDSGPTPGLSDQASQGLCHEWPEQAGQQETDFAGGIRIIQPPMPETQVQADSLPLQMPSSTGLSGQIPQLAPTATEFAMPWPDSGRELSDGLPLPADPEQGRGDTLPKAPVIGIPKELQEAHELPDQSAPMPYWHGDAEDIRVMDPPVDPASGQNTATDLIRQEVPGEQQIRQEPWPASPDNSYWTGEPQAAQLPQSDPAAQGLVLEWPDPTGSGEDGQATSATDDGQEDDWQTDRPAPGAIVPKLQDLPARKPEYAPVPLPSTELLVPPAAVEDASDEELHARGELLMQKLADFGVTGELVQITPGPVVTMFEMRPSPGIRVSRVLGLADDIALALKALSVRIQAPIPGTDTVGIEVPNEKRQMVNFRELAESENFVSDKGPLTMVLGKDIAGRPYMADLSTMPHLLVAGATGAGKSVCLNGILVSLLYRTQPRDMRLLLVDPKRIEMAVYADEPHLIHPVVTETEDAQSALDWAVSEMDRRYKDMARLGARNITSYNQRLAERRDSLTPDFADLEHMPYLVIVIDELADLMMTAGREVEQAIVRLAQLARAAGIHMILATQRPSVDVVTGLIKANFPCRISFQVTSMSNSRTILDQGGAERLLGKGDMLFKPSGKPLVRLHGPFLSDDEVHAVVSHWKYHLKPDYVVDFASMGQEAGGSGGPGGKGAANDPLYKEVVAFVMEHGSASTSLVQRHFRIGYNRAATIMDQLQEDGLVGPANGSKPRAVIR